MNERHFPSQKTGRDFRVHVHQQVRQKAAHTNEFKDGRGPR